MIEADAVLALEHWGLESCPVVLVAARENRVFRVEAPVGPLALRLHRPGYRSAGALRSELDWMATVAVGGLVVPRPVPALSGACCIELDDTFADVLTWIDGLPLGRNGNLTGAATAVNLLETGRALARLHSICDRWTPPTGFERPVWNIDGLLGDNPLWGRFWENPFLDASQAALMREARQAATETLRLALDPDFGLIHADVVPENVIIGNTDVAIIDFDDGGFGYRLFDLATTMNRLDRHDPSGALSGKMLAGYRSQRRIDLSGIEVHRLVRSLTYVGWIVPHLGEPGSRERCDRFVREACFRASQFLSCKGENAS